MPVSDFECQIARGQIGRYLSGGILSPQAMEGLEEHLAECPNCKALVAERRAALMEQLAGGTPTHAVVEMPVENPLIAALKAKAEEAAQPVASAPAPTGRASVPRYANGKAKPAAAPKPAKSASPKEGAKPSFAKPLALAGLLGVVLLGMNSVSRFTKGESGPSTKADAAFADASLPAATPAPTPASTTPKPRPAASQPVPAAKPVPVKSLTTTPEKTDFDAAEMPKPLAKNPTPVNVVPNNGVATKKVAIKKAPVKTAAKVPVSKPKLVAKIVAMPPHAAPKARPVRRLVVRRAARPLRRMIRARAPHVRRASAHTSVRVYGLDGRPIKP